MKNEYLLSICIPTYNRSECLVKCVESIIKQKAFIDNNVEVVILNNASTDDTDAVIQTYIKTYTNIKYYKNEVGMGDERYLYLLGKANGKLRKLSNDSIVYKRESLQRICELIKKNRDRKPLVYFSNKNRRNLYEFKNFKDFVLSESFLITWISSFSIWDEECDDYTKDTIGCKELLWQVAKIGQLGSCKDDVLVINNHFMISQELRKKDISYGLYKTFYVDYFKLLKPYLEKNRFNVEEMEFLKKDLLYNFFTDWIINWEFKNKKLIYSQEENLKELIFNEYKDKKYWKQYYIFYKIKKIKKYIKNKIQRG